MLLFFGNIKEIDESKVALRQEMDISENEHDPSFITTSPLDYHLFRQEITSKYPAYCPPPPLVPIEEENNSILPPLPNHPTRQASIENLRMAAGATANGAGRSIFHQPVHIATPAPSPPPSPAGPGGKGGKKQNYQTNQNFPFLYPPLDDTSNTVGGKGNAELQDQLVGKRWEGSDVPASILEAGQLFASRMRMSRSIRQLWDVREKFIKYERGWNRSKDDYDSPHEDSEFGSNDDDTEGEAERSSARSKDEEPKWEKETDKEEVQRRLDAINSFYVRTPKFGESPSLIPVPARQFTASTVRSGRLLETCLQPCIKFGRSKWSGRITEWDAFPRRRLIRGSKQEESKQLLGQHQ